VRFTAIFSNPPIRVGKAALHELLSTWLHRLTPEGRAWLVVHKHLGSDSLAAWLAGEGFAVRRLGSRMGYRLLEVAPG
jgi:16S rRNA (guanine1207-N2)-methyltransferase